MIANRCAAVADTDTGSIFVVGFRRTRATSPLSSSYRVRVVGSRIPDASASPTLPITSSRDRAAGRTISKICVPHVRHVIESDGKMIPSSWKSRRDRAEFRSRKGGVDSTLADLLDVAASIHIESSLWPDFRAVDLYMSAWQIQTIAIHYARHEVDKHTAETWIEAGNAYLAAMRRERVHRVE